MRIFKPEPGVQFSEETNPNLVGKSVDEVKRILAQLGYPQVLNSTSHENKAPNGDITISFLPAAGKKG